MSTEENQGPRQVKFHRIVPQIKTFKKGTLLKNKVDLYYSLEEDIVETGGDDNFSPLASIGQSIGGGLGPGASFPQSADFICKETTLLFVEAAQFRADDNYIYVRAQLLTAEKVVWVNVLRVPNRIWAFKIRSEQKAMIKNEIEAMFSVIAPGNVN